MVPQPLVSGYIASALTSCGSTRLCTALINGLSRFCHYSAPRATSLDQHTSSDIPVRKRDSPSVLSA